MSQFIAGKLKPTSNGDVFGNGKSAGTKELEFSDEAQAVFAAGRELWKYYHAQENINVSASFYDIRAHFQGRNPKGRMNRTETGMIQSQPKEFLEMMGDLPRESRSAETVGTVRALDAEAL